MYFLSNVTKTEANYTTVGDYFFVADLYTFGALVIYSGRTVFVKINFSAYVHSK